MMRKKKKKDATYLAEDAKKSLWGFQKFTYVAINEYVQVPFSRFRHTPSLILHRSISSNTESEIFQDTL